AQGRSNQFTSLTAKDRKEVFRKILGLERYEQLSVRANDQRKESGLRLKALERATEEARSELARLPSVEQSLATLTQEREALLPLLATLGEEVLQLRQAAGDYERLRQTAVRAERSVHDTGGAIEELRASNARSNAELVSAREQIRNA